MSQRHSDVLEAVFLLAILIYSAIGVLVISRWKTRRLRRWGGVPSIKANPEGWLAFWMPLAVVTEVWAWLVGIAATALILVETPIASGHDGRFVVSGLVVGHIGFAVLMAVYDLVMVAQARRMRRRIAIARQG